MVTLRNFRRCFWAILILLCYATALSAAGREEVGRPAVEISVRWAEIFAGEDPGVGVKLTAPADRAVRVLKKEYFTPGVYMATITGPLGEKYMSRIPKVDPPVPLYGAEDVVELEPGASMVAEEVMSIRPRTTGEYHGEVSAYVVPDARFKVVREVRFRVSQMEEKDIVRRWPVVVQRDADARAAGLRAELLSVRMGQKFMLFCQVTEPPGEVRLRRLWEIGAGTSIDADTVGFERGSAGGWIRVRFEEGGKKQVRYLSAYDGSSEQGAGGATTRSAGEARE